MGWLPCPRCWPPGVKVCLGTDGCASNNDQDLFGEMDSCAKLAKASRLDPTVAPAEAVVSLCTSRGAAAFGRPDDLGMLRPGALADVIVVDTNQPHLTPMYNPMSHLVYAVRGGDVLHTVCHGKVLMAEGKVEAMDQAEVMAKGQGAGQGSHRAGGVVMPQCLLITGGPLWAGPGKFWPQGAVAAVDGVITYAGPADGVPRPPQAEVIQADGGLIMPGLVNAHCHGAMVLFRGLADDLPLNVWLQEHMFPAEARWVSDEMVELCSRLAAAEMLLSGTTTVGDSYFCLDGAARAYASAGIRAALYHGVIDFPAPGVPDPADNLATARRFVQRWKGESPLLSAGIFAHSSYTCSSETLRDVADLTAEQGLPVAHPFGRDRRGVNGQPQDQRRFPGGLLGKAGPAGEPEHRGALRVAATRRGRTAGPAGGGGCRLPRLQQQAGLGMGSCAPTAGRRGEGGPGHRRRGLQQQPGPLRRDRPGRPIGQSENQGPPPPCPPRPPWTWP